MTSSTGALAELLVNSDSHNLDEAFHKMNGTGLERCVQDVGDRSTLEMVLGVGVGR